MRHFIQDKGEAVCALCHGSLCKGIVVIIDILSYAFFNSKFNFKSQFLLPNYMQHLASCKTHTVLCMQLQD